MLELDIVLKRFVERELDRLTPGQLAALQALLEFPDNDLWDLVSGRYQPPDADADMQSVTSLLRSV
jgi:antitoxin CptB